LRYSAFGETRYSSGITATNYRYTGQLQQADINLYYYNARYYDPALGRFVQSDTVIPQPNSVQGYDRYAYVNNNPLRYTDPSGHANEQGTGGGLSSYKQLAKAFEKVVAKTSYSSYNGHRKEYLSTVSAYYYAQASGNKAATANNYMQVMDQKNRLIVNGYSTTSNAQSTAFNMAGMEVSGMAGGIIGIATSAMSTRSVSTEFNIYARTENLGYTTIYPSASNPFRNIESMEGGNPRSHTSKHFNTLQSDNALYSRAQVSNKPQTRFSDMYQAEYAINEVHVSKYSDIITLANSGESGTQGFTGPSVHYNGYKMEGGSVIPISGVGEANVVVWYNGQGSWGLYTAYPIP
jgi:RHS repeat-associated protein